MIYLKHLIETKPEDNIYLRIKRDTDSKPIKLLVYDNPDNSPFISFDLNDESSKIFFTHNDHDFEFWINRNGPSAMGKSRGGLYLQEVESSSSDLYIHNPNKK